MDTNHSLPLPQKKIFVKKNPIKIECCAHTISKNVDTNSSRRVGVVVIVVVGGGGADVDVGLYKTHGKQGQIGLERSTS